jgi:hypothetical protein
MELVTIQTYTYPQDMAVVRSLLESEGINTFAMDEMVTYADPIYSNAVGGVKLQVAAEDAERAIEIMLEKGFIKKPASKKQTIEDKLSSVLNTQKKSAWIIALVFVLAVVLVYYIFRNS